MVRQRRQLWKFPASWQLHSWNVSYSIWRVTYEQRGKDVFICLTEFWKVLCKSTQHPMQRVCFWFYAGNRFTESPCWLYNNYSDKKWMTLGIFYCSTKLKCFHNEIVYIHAGQLHFYLSRCNVVLYCPCYEINNTFLFLYGIPCYICVLAFCTYKVSCIFKCMYHSDR